jgi:hypothetical protein
LISAIEVENYLGFLQQFVDYDAADFSQSMVPFVAQQLKLSSLKDGVFGLSEAEVLAILGKDVNLAKSEEILRTIPSASFLALTLSHREFLKKRTKHDELQDYVERNVMKRVIVKYIDQYVGDKQIHHSMKDQLVQCAQLTNADSSILSNYKCN